MSTSMLVRSLRIYRGLPPSSSVSAYTSLTGNTELPWPTSYLGINSAVLPIRPFSSKPDGNDVVTDVKNPKVIENSEGVEMRKPYVAGFHQQKGEQLVGTPSWHQAMTNSTSTVSAGTNKHFDDDAQGNDQKDISTMKLLAYKIVKAPDGDVWVEGNGQQYSLSVIAPLAFKTMKEKAESYLIKSACIHGDENAKSYFRKRLSKAMIIVPDYFTDAQRQATKDAAIVAGLDVKTIVDETTTSELSYEINKLSGDAIAVFDLSGGTFDLSIKLILNCYGVVKETSDTFEASLLEYFVGKFKSSHGVDLSKDHVAFKRIQEEIGKARRELLSTWATYQTDQINIPI